MALEYFWETEYKFGEFLKKVFGEQFKRKYSLQGNGIYNLLFIDDNIYEVEYKKATANVGEEVYDKNTKNCYPDCGNARYGGPTKQDILYQIGKNLKVDKVYAKSAEMSFPIANWTAKIKIVKKNSEPK